MEQSDYQDILYPEVHLNSPIVISKLVGILEYAQVIHNQQLTDHTIIKNIQFRLRNGFNSPRIQTLSTMGEIINKIKNKYPNYIHIPYPECNQKLFRIVDPELTSKLESLLNKGDTLFLKIRSDIIKCFDKLKMKMNISNDLLNDNSQLILDLPLIIKGSQWFFPFLFWFSIKTETRSCIRQNPKARVRSQYRPHLSETKRITLVVTSDLITIFDHINKCTFYLTFEMLLMYCDVIEGRLMTETAMSLDCRFTNLLPRVQYMWDLLDGMFESLGNQLYSVIALLEPLSLAYLQLIDADPQIRGTFLHHCFSELEEIIFDKSPFDPFVYENLINGLDYIYLTDDIHLTAEVFSFFRSFGHPYLEAQNAANNVRKYMNQPKVISYQTLMQGHAIFCGIIINGFRDRHGGTWPPVELPSHASAVIRNAQLSGEGLTSEQCAQHWRSFCGFKFKCFMPLSLDSDLTMYLRDKALSPVRSEWDSVYAKEYLRYNPGLPTSSRRLVNVFLEDDKFDPYEMIMYVINGDYLRDNEFNLSYSLKEKEIKEVGRLFAKMTYKMRACQVIAENLIANGVGKFFKDNGMAKDEHKLTKTLHKLAISGVPKDNSQLYLDECWEQVVRQCSSDTHTTKPIMSSQPKRIIESKSSRPPLNHRDTFKGKRDPNTQLKYPSNTEYYETISSFITTDLKKYCLNWRYESSSVFAERLNEIYGLPGFFQWLHKILEKSVLYVSDPSSPPDFDQHVDIESVPNDHIFIKYPMGGIEGFCQKLWTISTIPFLYLAAFDTGVRIASLVQGDNQAIAVTKRVPSSWSYSKKKEESTKITTQYFLNLRQRLHDIGHELKANETIISSHFFVYSKGIYYDGILLSQALKSMARCVFWSETIVDETRSACSNISTTLAKAIERGYDKFVAYAINIYKTIHQVLIALSFTINPTMTPDITEPFYKSLDLLKNLVLIPAPLGGMNYMNMSRLFVRNIGDPITASFADIKRMIECGLLGCSILSQIMYQKCGSSKYLDWASDPYSINLPYSQSMTKVLKNVTARYVLMHSPNPMLKDLFHEKSQEEDEILAEFLLDRHLIIPRAAHEILSNSVTGARESIAGMLDTTKGLIRASMSRGGLTSSLVLKLSTYDYQQFRTCLEWLYAPTTGIAVSVDLCSVFLAKTIRKRMWVHLTKGREIYGLEVPDILECMQNNIIIDHEDCYSCIQGSRYYTWFFVPSNCQLDQINKSTNSLRVPYVGSTTEERSDMRLSYVRSPSRPLKAAVRIAAVYTWAYGDDDLSWHEAWYLARTRANITFDELKLITPIATSTNLAHRLRDRSTQVKYSGTSLVRVARYTTISNDNMSFIINNKKVDTNFVYQQGMLLGLSILEYIFRYCTSTGQSNTVIHLHADVNCCIVQMTDQPYTPSLTKKLPDIKPINNKLIYDPAPIIDTDAARLYSQKYLSHLIDFPSWSTTQLNTVLAKVVAVSIVELITKASKDHLNEIIAVVGDDDINSFITEFLLVDPRLFTLYLGQYTSLQWAYEVHYHRPVGKYQMAEVLHNLLSRASRGIFSVLTNAFSHPRVYRRFWECGLLEPIYGPYIGSQNLHTAVIDYIYNAYITYLDAYLSDQVDDTDIIICETEETCLSNRIDNYQSRHLAILIDLYCDSTRCPNIKGSDTIMRNSILRSFIDNERRTNPLGLAWNLDPLLVDHFSCSITYLRRGIIKQMRLRFDPNISLELAKMIKPDVIYQAPKVPSSWALIDINPEVNDLNTIFGELNSKWKDIPIGQIRIQNYEIHAYRRIGVNSTACYKALEILSVLNRFMSNPLGALFLGEGAGSMLVTYRAFIPFKTIYYNSGISVQNVQGQRELSLYPSEVALVDNKNRLANDPNIKVLFNGKPESTWVGNIDCFAYILSHIETASLTLIHSDIESSLSKTKNKILEELCHILSMALILGRLGSVLVIKLLPRVGDYTYSFCKYASEFYQQNFLILPRFSNMSSSEVYYIGVHLNTNRLIDPDRIVQYIIRNLQPTPVTFLSYIFETKYRNNMVTNYGLCLSDGHKSDYLSSITKIENVLLSCELELDGPKIIPPLSGHDYANGETSLESSIMILVREYLNATIQGRETLGLFSPYPVLHESQLREINKCIALKYIVYLLFYSNSVSSSKQIMSNLRKGILMYDLRDEFFISRLSANYKKKVMSQEVKTTWIFNIDTPTRKALYKLVGYSLIIHHV
uniref:RNA-directed RNA polymerase L n=1 Tax=Feline morbillivirus TaxID=1170234 RepID=A0A2P0ZK24_9MONO|nr:RNA polymerase [Feline morbillivirus]